MILLNPKKYHRQIKSLVFVHRHGSQGMDLICRAEFAEAKDGCLVLKTPTPIEKSDYVWLGLPGSKKISTFYVQDAKDGYVYLGYMNEVD